ncbi:hypothetical protein IEQ34_022290 [Dendrobium chrysotoxum]|uniref:Receptor kinase-like protein Xa21 n=1 Tax=Dendrobium chrysotoxum TaxID=161865 RepID=A0AAV7FYM9_DENCH|nr:hypothetical protein IEQ34_022290 [Dendrobium chrysotoxum]
MASPFWPFSQVKVCVFLLFLSYHPYCLIATSISKTFNKNNGSSSDELALLAFKSHITHDPYGGLASWDNHSLHFCQWHGVTCSKHRHQVKVTALNLQALALSGSISSSIGNLTFLRRLHLSENLLYGHIPKEFGMLSNLLHLNLSFNLLEGLIPHTLSKCFLLQTISLMNNSFHGEIPSNLSCCSDIQIIDFRNNFFSGIIPASLGALKHLKQLLFLNNMLEAKEESDWAFLIALANCSNLQILSLSRNRLEGVFSSSITNLSSGLQILTIANNQITGSIPPSICRFKNLQILSLEYNLLQGTIPEEIGILHKLKFLNLANNQIIGPIPNSFGNLSSLQIFSISGNQFGGSIPTMFQNLSSLTFLSLSKNNFVGYVPQFFESLINLTELYLAFNNLFGRIPPSLGNLHTLNTLALAFNNLNGVIPYSILNLSSLQHLQLQQNNLFGIIPPNIGQTLPNLISLMLYQNQFHGPIPTSLSNCSSLELIDLHANAFTGKVHLKLGASKNLYALALYSNKLEASDSTDWAFLESLKNCTKLEVLLLHDNELNGILPGSIANLSAVLRLLGLSGNKIGGTIPAEIKNLVGLSWLDLGKMHLTGIIPPAMGSLPSLQIIELNNNELHGEIPNSFGNLSRLNELHLNYNKLSGHIPPTLGLCNKLELINLESNMLIGTVPAEITALVSLTIGISLSKNLLSGLLPSNVGSLINLNEFDISNNKLSGRIPDSLGLCKELQYLYMENNFFEGTIPSSLEALRGLQKLDLSHNKLIGEIPEYLTNFSLQYLNLSFNLLEGEVPTIGIFANASAFSVFGNKQLCGGIPELHLPTCFNQLTRKARSKLVVVIIVVSVTVLFIILIVIFIAWRKKSCKISPSIWRLRKEQHEKVSYATLLKATNEFSHENLIGIGSFGSVYRGNMNIHNNSIVAVKVFNLQRHGASKSFEVECKALRSARHRNLVKVLTVCSSIDYTGNNFKALVFEFMSNGSLDKWLHAQFNDGNGNRAYLNLTQRLNIAIDVASALDYLHNQGSTQIIHCDLKPSNILLDKDMVAHVGDFGIAKLLTEGTTESDQKSTNSISLKGTIGYVAPEYGMANQVSTRGDVYSFGILLLEIVTGRRPTDGNFIESHSIQKYVQRTLPEQVMSIIDPKMFSLQGDEEVGNEIQHINNIRKHELECIIAMLNIGLLCSKESPLERIQIGEASNELHAIKDIFNKAEQAQHN